jgi:hypothetical protein
MRMSHPTGPSVGLRPSIVGFAVALASGVLAACSSGGSATNANGGSGGGATGGGGNGGATGTADAIVGTFSIILKSDTPPAITGVSGKVYDGPTPELLGWTVAAKDGDCTLSTPTVPFCSQACVGGVCVADETCRPNPAAKDVGAVTLSGVKTQTGAASLSLVKTTTLAYVDGPDSPPPAYPPFDEGADVALRASGGAYGAFEIHAKGIAPLVVSDAALVVERNKPLALSWTAKGAASDATIHVLVDLSHHAGSKGKIECDTADSGALTISAALVTQLVNLGVAGYPKVEVMRVTSGSTTIAPGRVILKLSHNAVREAMIPGLVSCSDIGAGTGCPSGQTCQTDLTCK